MQYVIFAIIILFTLPFGRVASAKALSNTDGVIESRQYQSIAVIELPDTFIGCTNFHDAQLVVQGIENEAQKKWHKPDACGLVGNWSVWVALHRKYSFRMNRDHESQIGLISFEIFPSDIYMGGSNHEPVAMKENGTLEIFVIVQGSLYEYLKSLHDDE